MTPSQVILTLNSYVSIFIGRGLILRHLRWNPECEVMEELAPIDQNLRYDFDYQQTTHLPKEVTILPVGNSS